MPNTLANEYEIAYNSIIADYELYEETLDQLYVNNYDDKILTKEKYVMLFITIEILKSVKNIIDIYKGVANSKRDIKWEDVSNTTIRGFTIFGRIIKNMINIRYTAFGQIMNIINTESFKEFDLVLSKSIAYWWKMITSDFMTLYDRYSRLNKMYKQGYRKYRFYTEEDIDVCDECGSLHGKDFPLTRAIVGINLPPIHPWCRCWILPIK